MPPKVSAADHRLLSAYQEAALRIQRVLQTLTPRNRQVVLRRIDSLLAELDAMTADYIGSEVPFQFKQGSAEAVAELRKLQGFGDIDPTFGTLHTEAVNQLAQDSTLKFANALEGVRRESQSLVTSQTKQQIINELITQEIQGGVRPQDAVKQILEEQGIVSIRSSTRKWTLEDYASMLTHNVLADAHNTGAATRYLANGVQFAQVIERATAPDFTCQWMSGKIIWLGDRRLLNPYHPNCMGGIAPVLGEPADAIKSPDDPRIPDEVRTMLLKKY